MNKMSAEERTRLITKAASLPKGNEERREILATLLEHDADTVKVAMNPRTYAFVDWVLLNNADSPWSERKMVKYVEKMLGHGPKPYVKKPQAGPKIEVGDSLLVKDMGAKNPEINEDAIERYKYQFCTVQEVRSDSVVVQMNDSGQKVEFFGTQTGVKPPEGTGLYRGKPKADYMPSEDRTRFEVVYLAANERVTQYQEDMVKQYADRGQARGEKRHKCYYSGPLVDFKVLTDGRITVSVNDQQRPYPVGISPKKGQLLYMGVLNRRPSGWEKDMEQDVAELIAEAG